MAGTDNEFKPEMKKVVRLALHWQGSEVLLKSILYICLH